jgi:hypothetical protein
MISSQDNRLRAGVVGRRDQLLVALVALAASVPGLLNDFVYDDNAIIRDNVRVHDLAHWRDVLTMPYWPPPYVEQLYRPVAVLMLAIQYVLGGGSPLTFRVISYALYAGCAIGVFRLASRLLSRNGAVAVAVLFAAHPVHVEAVALGVNQGELLVAILAVVMTCRYLDGRRAGTLGLRDWVILAALYAVAALTKESGFVLPGLLVCAELTLIGGRPFRARVLETLDGYLLLAAVGVGLLAVRIAVLPAGAVGAIPAVDLRGMDLAGRVVAMLQAVPTWLRLFVWPAQLQVGYHLDATPWSAALREIIGLTLISTAAATAYRARRRAPVVSFGLVWCGVALLPVTNLIPTGVFVAERTLLLPSVGFLITVGGLAELVLRRWPSTLLRRRVIAACVVVTVLGIARSLVRQLSWNSAHVTVVKRPTRSG